MAKGAIVRLAKEGLALEASEGVLLVFDTPQTNQRESGGFQEMMSRLAKSIMGGAPVHHLETQHYFAVDFAPVEEPSWRHRASSSGVHRA
jgi:hypothetical protein